MSWKLYPLAQFPAFIDAWDHLNQSNCDTPLLDSDFVAPLLDVFATGKQRIAVFGSKQSPEAMAVIEPLKPGLWATFQPSQAPIGLWLQREGLDTMALSESLRKTIPGLSLAFSVTQQDPLLLPRPADQGRSRTLDYIDTARVAVSGSFDDYWSSRGKNLKQNMRRQRSRLAREEVDVEFRVISEREEMRTCIEEYGRLESAGWKASGGTAINIDNDQGRFYLDMLQRFCARDQAVVFQYRYNGELVAIDLCIYNARSLIILKTTYEESIKTTSPAILMRQDSFRHLFGIQPCEYIEFYGKVMEWHTKWSDDIRTMYHCNQYNALLAQIKR